MNAIKPNLDGIEAGFLRHLRRLENDRGAMAALRRSADGSPASLAPVHRYVVPFLSPAPNSWRDPLMYLTAALFAVHPARGAPDGESLGATFRRLDKDRDQGGMPTESVERRFVALLATDPDDIAYPLRQATTLLKSREVPVCWEQLLRDLGSWRHPDAWIQQRWARDFWGDPRPARETPEGDHHAS